MEWFKNNNIQTLPSDQEISIVSKEIDVTVSKIKKYICKQLNIQYEGRV